jgi:hypothetical protein
MSVETNPKPSTESVIEAEHRRGAALVERDFATLRRMIAKDLTHTHTRGATDDFDSYFHFIEHKIDFLQCTRGELKVRMLGNVAIMSGLMHNLVRLRDKETATSTNAQVLQVWEWRSGEWVMLAFQSTSVPN